METITLIAPSAWANAIVNCDYSGLEKEDRVAINHFLTDNDLSFVDCLSCEDYGYTRFHDAFKQCPYGADCQKYIFAKSS